MRARVRTWPNAQRVAESSKSRDGCLQHISYKPTVLPEVELQQLGAVGIDGAYFIKASGCEGREAVERILLCTHRRSRLLALVMKHPLASAWRTEERQIELPAKERGAQITFVMASQDPVVKLKVVECLTITTQADLIVSTAIHIVKHHLVRT